MKRTTRRWLIGGGVAVLVIAVAFFFLRGSGPGASEGPRPVLVSPENVYVVGVHDLRSGPILSGSLEPVQEATVRSQLAASVLSMTVSVGDRVQQGQVLGRLDDRAVREAYQSARSGVTAAEQAAALAKRNAERYAQLEAAGAVAKAQLEQAQSEAQSAQSRLDQARATLASATQRLDQTVIQSPLTGVVSDRPVDPGDVVQPGMALVTVVDPASMVLQAMLPTDDVDAIQVGDTVRFDISGASGPTYRGVVREIAPVADQTTRQVPVRVAFPNAGPSLVAGMFAEGRVVTESSRRLAIPLSALLDVVGPPMVLRIQNGEAERVAVELGLRDDAAEMVAVTGGPLAAGDTVLTGAARDVGPGTAVRMGEPVPAGGTAPAGDSVVRDSGRD